MKFWNFKNEADSETADLLLYGPISDSTWWGDEVTPTQFANDLAAIGGKNVNVRINSPGGDVFAAHAIFSQLVNYAGDITIHVDGLAASAATIIMMAGKVIMPTNSMVMIHNPAMGLMGYYDAVQMVKMAADLETVKKSIIAAYKNKCNLDDKKMSKLMDDETWMTAETAKEYGFADEVTGLSDTVNMAMDGSCFIVNSIKHKLSNLKNTAQLRNLVNKNQPVLTTKKPKEEQKLEIKNMEDLKKAHPDLINQAVADGIKNERERITALDAINDITNATIVEIINDAKTTGKTAAEVEPVINIVKKHSPATTDLKNAQQQFKNMIIDNKNSGADGVVAIGGDTQVDEKQKDAADISFMASVINKKFGRNK